MRTAAAIVCTRCGSAENGFSSDNRKKNGLRSICKECMNAYTKAWKEANPEKMNAWNKANPEKVKALNKSWRDANPEKARASSKTWKEANPEKARAYERNRRARLLNVKGKHTSTDIKRLLELQKGKCPVCKCSIRSMRHVDHIVPLSRGGSNDKGNLQLLCPTCNMQKNAKDPIAFAQERGMLL